MLAAVNLPDNHEVNFTCKPALW